jgi:hypothetical protein
MWSSTLLLEFGDVKVVIGCADQMSLAPSAHSPNMLDCGKGFGGFHRRSGSVRRVPPFGFVWKFGEGFY